ncbi:MAG: histidine kinase [Bacteroidota bacterium]
MTHQLRLICLLFFVSLAGMTKQAAAQNRDRTFGKVFLFDLVVTDKRSMTTEPTYLSAPDTAVHQIFDKLKKGAQKGFVNQKPKSPILLGVKLNPSLTAYFSESVQSISKDYQTFIISDSSEAVLIAMGINAGNAKDFKYHVVENDSTELVPWSPIPKLEQRYGAKQPYGLIGKFTAPGKRIMVEVQSKKDYSVREGVIFVWRKNFKPILEQLTLSTPTGYFNLAYKNINHGYATEFDKLSGLPKDLKFPQDSVYSITIQLKKEETMAREAHLIRTRNGKAEVLKLGSVDRWGYFNLDRSLFDEPGHYELLIKRKERVPVWDYSQMMSIEFYVLPVPFSAKTYSIKQLLPYIIGVVLFIVVLFFGLRRYAKKRVADAEKQQANVQLKLRSIRAQLNPHFMFNALSSIQNLMNKDQLLEANHYLSKFAGLTRKVLNTSEQEIISLEDELKIAQDYLQMEQLRFGFNYQVNINADINQANTDIPAMLLQPFIENAVKHGIALLKDKGEIKVNVTSAEGDLIMIIKDNGKGFDTDKLSDTESGFGLKLSHERISLLNQIYKGQPAALNIEATTAGTTVTITLKNWL